MEEQVGLLDTPKKKSLQSQAETLRLALKDYEHTFAAEHNGRKPSRNEIKSNRAIATKYQQYQTVRDVLAGKRNLEALNTPKRRQSTRQHERTDSAISLTPHHKTKSSQVHPNDIDPYDPPSSISPRVLPTAIGPTPRRDGTVLGIFDLLSHSGSRMTSRATPTSRKRKIDAHYEHASQHERSDAAVAQTPSQKRRQSSPADVGGIIPASTPRSSLATGKRNHSKTPISDCKRYMLNHFFATPSAVRFAGVLRGDSDTNTPPQGKTPLRDIVLGISPAKERTPAVPTSVNVDATPPYLKRSFSFKERLLSAFEEPTSRRSSMGRSLSGNLGKGSFAPKPLSQIIADRQQTEVDDKNKAEQHRRRVDDDEDDDLDALREMEATQINVLVEDSQFVEEADQARGNEVAEPEQLTRIWKKKGQKRTTRRIIMRPVKVLPATQRDAVPMIQDDDDESGVDEDDNNVSRVDETQLPDTPAAEDVDPADSDMEFLDDEPKANGEWDEDENEDNVKPAKPAVKIKSKTKSTTKPSQPDIVSKSNVKAKASKKRISNTGEDEPKTTIRTINPNAQSHMNFRSLKIKNKSSKAKGRGRFGRR